MQANIIMQIIDELVLGWPLIVFVTGVSLLCTVALKGVQFTRFFHAWKLALAPEKSQETATKSITPVQAFINTLSACLGNGAIAGMAVAVYMGGPGAAVWVVVIGILLMAVRFSEVYLSTWYGAQQTGTVQMGGPMLYLKDVVGGKYLSFVYAFGCLLYTFVTGSAMQSNSICISVKHTTGLPVYLIGLGLVVFVYYIVSGGAERIVKTSQAIVPIKVIVFFSSTIALLAYHYSSLLPALALMFKGAINPAAVLGGAVGIGMQQVIRVGMMQTIVATEAGLGTAAVLFGYTGSKDPMKSALLGMLTTFISTLVCFMVVWAIVASGVWNSGLNGTALTIAAFQTLFGNLAGWIVSFLSVTFGMGVLVAYGYIARAAWLYLTGGRWVFGCVAIYTASAFIGSIADVQIVWLLISYLNGVLMFTNLFGIACLVGKMKRHIASN